MQNSPKSSLVTISEAAKTLGIHKDTLRRWEKAGKIKVIRDHNGTRLYDINQLTQLPTKPRPTFRAKLASLNLTNKVATTVVKISEAAKTLGIHKDTLRRWEKAGKIEVDHKRSGTRLYKLDSLKKLALALNPPPTTEQLLNSAKANPEATTNLPPFPTISQPLYSIHQTISKNNNKYLNKLILIGSLITFSFFTITGIVTYFKFLSLFLFKAQTTPAQQAISKDNQVLGEATGQVRLKINADVKIGRSLMVNSTINGLNLAVAPEKGAGFIISANEATLSAQGTIKLDQDVSTTSSPTFAGLTVKTPIKAPSLNGATLALTGTSNQVVFNYDSSSKGTLTWTPTAARTITLPDITDTLVGKTTTDTLSNKTIKSGDSNTISGSYPDITGITSLGTVSTGTWNGTKIGTGYGGTGLTTYTTGDILYASAANTLSKLTIGSSGQSLIVSSGLPAWGSAAATGVTSLDSLTGALTISNTSGSGTTLTLDDASTTAKGIASFNSTNFSVSSGAVNTIQNISTSSSPAFTGLSLSSGNLGIGTSATGAALQVNGTGLFGWGTAAVAGPANGLAIFGNVGVGTTSPNNKLQVIGAGVFGTDYGQYSAPANGLLIQGNVGIGATTSSNKLDVWGNSRLAGTLTVDGTLTVSGSLVATGSQAGFWTRSGTLLSPNTVGDTIATTGNVGVGTTSPGSQLEVRGTGSGTALTVRSAPTGSSNIFDITNNAGTSSYFSIDSSGQMSGSAFKLTDASNAVVGTAIEGGWTLDGNTYTYRRTITVTNNDGSNSLPANYEANVSLNSADSNQVYSKSQTSSPYSDFRIGYYNGSTYTEIGRNVSSFTSSSVAFTFQLQAAIAASGSSSSYYIYYRNTSLSTTPSTYTGNTQLDNADTVANWTSGDSTGYPLSQETTIKQEGTGSVKAVALAGTLGTFSTTSQNALPQALTGATAATRSISGTNYIYVLGGNNGTSDQTTVYKSTVDSSGNTGAFSTTSQGQLPQALSGTVSFSQAASLDTGTGADGSIDLSLGSGAGGCTGTGLSWSGTTCTITTATKSTFNFTTVNIPSGTTLTTDSNASFLTIKATGAVTIGGTVNLNGKGGAGGTGSQGAPNGSAGTGTGGGGGGITNQSSAGGGGGGGGYASTGGAGGGGSSGGAGGTAGSAYSTESTGSGGGGGGRGGGGSGQDGGGGGGGIRINAGGNVSIATINANGNNGTAAGAGGGGGGGSGGRVIVQTLGAITLSGSITANGGNGGSGVNGGGGGGGSGGFITLSDNDGTIAGTTSVTAGSLASGGQNNAANGSAGTLATSALVSAIYILGGINGATTQSTVYKATVNNSADIGSFSTTSQGQLPVALKDLSIVTASVSSTNYVYVLGGNTGAADVDTAYKATVSSGNIGSFSTTSQGQLPQTLSGAAAATVSISGTNYVYVIGGINGSTRQTTVYKSTIDGSANLGAFSTTSQGQLPVALSKPAAFIATVGSTNYLYVIGGTTGSNVNTVYRATIDSSGNIGSFSTTQQSQLPQALSAAAVVNLTESSNQYAYLLGGSGSSTLSTVYKAPIGDMTSYTATRTISSANLSNKNDLQFKFYSSVTGSYMAFDFSEDGTTWQNCSFSVSSANTWETKTCDISGVASASRDAVTRIRTRITTSQTSDVTSYFDDINALTEASTISNTASNASAVLGANNLAINAQGTGLVQINYAASSSPQAGSGGMAVFDGGTSALFLINSSGNVGIGATGPSKFNILGSGTGTALSLLTQNSTLTNFGLAVLDNGNVGIGTTNPISAFQIGSALGLGGNVLSFSSGSGNLGIGITTPGGRLIVYGGNVGIGTSLPYSTLAVQGNVGIGYTGSNQAIPANGLAVFGNVGIGTTTANSTLSVSGNAHIGSLYQGVSAPSNGLLVDGNVGIGVTTTSQKLEVAGRIRMQTWTADGTTAVYYNAANGDLGVQASDVRLKTNITPIQNSLDIIKGINGVTFNWLTDEAGTQKTVGVVAQDILKVMPELVYPVSGPDGQTYYGVHYDKLGAVLVEAVKEQQNQINSLLTRQNANSSLLSELSVSSDGTLNAPEVKTGKLVISSEINLTAPALASLLANTSGVGFDSQDVLQGSNEVSIDVLTSLNSISEAVLGLQAQESTTSAQLTEIESRVESQESKVESLEEKLASLSAQIATTSAEIASASSSLTTNSLDLTPPDILLATQSAQLVNLEVTSDATISGQLTAYNLDIQNSLKSLGQTILANTLVAGDLTVDGAMSITANSISTLGNLKLQNGPLAGPVDFFNGLVTIDELGRITAASIQTNKLILSEDTLGESKIAAGTSETIIRTTALTEKSKVFVTPQIDVETPLFVTDKIIGQSFKVKLKTPALYDIIFDWSILDSP